VPKRLVIGNIGNKGLSTDPLPWELPPEFLTFGANFRIFAGSIRTSGGKADWSTAPAPFYPGHVIHVGATSGDYWLVCGRGEATPANGTVYAFDGQTWTDVSSSGGYAGVGLDDELLWTSCMLGQIPIINNPQHYPEYWSPQSPGQLMQPLQFDPTSTWQDKGYTFKVIRSHRNYLFALNLLEGVTEFPDSFRWSHIADINGLPPTWDETDQAFLAGKAALGGDGGAIIDGESMRDAFCIYSENSIDMLDYTNDEFVWRRRELSATVGLLSRNAMVEVKGQHFFLADGDIVVNDGNRIESIAHNRIRRQLNARVSVDYYNRSYAVRNDSLKEVWFCVPEEDAKYPNVAYIYNWKDNSWAIRQIPYIEDAAGTAVSGIAYAGYGSQADPTRRWDDFTDLETWDSQTQVWGSSERTPLDDTVVGCDPLVSKLVLLDPSGTPDDDIQTRIERTDFPLEGQDNVTTITRVYPHVQGTLPMSFQFGSQDFAGAPIRWKPPIVFDPDQDRKIDVRTTGELHCWRVDSIGKNNWQMSGMTFEYENSGKR
jgi:hypothetical protein